MRKKNKDIVQTQINVNTYNNYRYTTDGTDTTISPLKRVKNDRRLSKYKVIEVIASFKKRRKYTMRDYLVEDGRCYPVPGLGGTNILGENCTTMVPQGICKMDNYLLITAYDSDGANNSVIYVLDENNHLKATLVYNRGCHMGGIAYDGKYLWIAEGSKSGLGAISKEDILGAIKVSEEKNAKSVQLKNIIWQKVSEITSTSYCTYYDNRLWIGIFNKDEDSHTYGYEIDYSKDVPTLIKKSHIQVPKRAQGICFYETKGIIYLAISTSYGRYSNSVIWCYKITGLEEFMMLNEGREYKKIILPPMSEQISVDGDKMYCIFESGARKYLMNLDKYGYSRRPIGSYTVFDTKKILG